MLNFRGFSLCRDEKKNCQNIRKQKMIQAEYECDVNGKLIKEKERTALQCNETVKEGNTTEFSCGTQIQNSKNSNLTNISN